MKVLLTKDVSGLGRAGDVKEVSDGHARNFLIPRHFALPATTTVLQQVQKEESEHQAKVKKEQVRFEQLKNKLQNKTFTITSPAGKQNLFAAIRAEQIAQLLKEKLNLEITADQIRTKSAVKTLGQHEVRLQFGQNKEITILLEVKGN